MPKYGITVSTHQHYTVALEADSIENALRIADSLTLTELADNAIEIDNNKNITSYAELDIEPVEWLRCDI
jgi:hypothetical protein